MHENRVPHPWKTLGRNPIASAWSPEDHARLLKLAGTMHPADIALALGRTESAIRSRCKAKGISLATTHPNKRWTPEEEAYLSKSHVRLTIRQMAKALGRSYYSTHQKTNAMGLDCILYGDKNHQAVYSEEDVELCRTLFDEGMTRREIADKLGIPYPRIAAWIAFEDRKTANCLLSVRKS